MFRARCPNGSRQRGGAPTAGNTNDLYEPDPVRAKILTGFSFGQHVLQAGHQLSLFPE
jgi:hypothetical protein